MPKANQTPEQAARVIIDRMLEQAGWKVQSKDRIDFSAGPGIAVREYQTDIGPADYVLFVNKKAVWCYRGQAGGVGGKTSRRLRRNPAVMPPPRSSG